MRKIHAFNMVEVLLAIVVLSLGMTSVFVLFPAGLSNHRSAMAENSMADLAEFIVSRIRADIALNSNNETLLASIISNNGRSITYDMDDDSNWTKVDNSGSGDPKGTLMVNNSFSNVYLVRQLSGPVDDRYTDFAAIAVVYQDDGFENQIFVPMNRDGDILSYNDIATASDPDSVVGTDPGYIREMNIDNILMPLVLEISYPADISWDDREKLYFRFEIFNESFEQEVVAP